MNMLDKLAKMPVPLRGLRTMARVTCPRCAALRNLQRGALSATVTISPASGHFQRSNLSAIGTPRTFAVTSWSQFRASAISRSPELEDEIAKITDLYGDAKDELEYAVESRGTVYYNDDKKGASEAIEKVLSAYNEALNSLADSEKADLQRRIGLKVHELRAQYDDLTKEDVEGDDH